MGNTFKTGNYVNGIFQDTSNNIGIGAAPSGTYKFEITGTSKVSGVLTLGSTLSNGTYTYTLPAATGTLALVGGAGVGTVTSVAALTIGTSGTDLSSTVATSTTTPVITLNVPTASAANRGALSSADWTTFNNKQSALTNPVTGTGTNNKVPKFTSTGSTIGDSAVTDNGTNVLLTSRNIILTNTATAQFYIESNNGAYSPSINAGGTGNGLGYTTGQMYFANPSNVITFNTKASSAESMRIDASGNVGIGTVSTQATYKVTISGTDTIFPAIYLENTTNTQAYSIRATGTNFLVRDNTSGNDRFTIASTGAATFSSGIATLGYTASTSYAALFNGSVGIGTSSPYKLLTTSTSTAMSTQGNAELIRLASTAQIGYTEIGFSSYDNQFYSNVILGSVVTSAAGYTQSDFYIATKGGTTNVAPTERMRITSGGNVLIGTTTDDTINKLQVSGGIYSSNYNTNFNSVTINSSTNVNTAVLDIGIVCFRDAVNGGGCLVFYENGQTPVIVSQSGGTTFTTSSPSATQIQISDRSGSRGLQALGGSSRNSVQLIWSVFRITGLSA